jgi:hypothetical protein
MAKSSKLGVILIMPDAIPAAITVGPAKEMVGQPFLRDHEQSQVLTGGAVVLCISWAAIRRY